MNFLAIFLSLFVAVIPPSSFICDGELLRTSIRNNLNGDFALIKDIEEIDQGAFIVLDWKKISLMLPVSFQAGEISFTDKKWLWSYQDNDIGLHENTPRFAQRLPNGEIVEYDCNPYKSNTLKVS